MNFTRIQAAEVKLWDFSAYFWNIPRSNCFKDVFLLKENIIKIISTSKLEL